MEKTSNLKQKTSPLMEKQTWWFCFPHCPLRNKWTIFSVQKTHPFPVFLQGKEMIKSRAIQHNAFVFLTKNAISHLNGKSVLFIQFEWSSTSIDRSFTIAFLLEIISTCQWSMGLFFQFQSLDNVEEICLVIQWEMTSNYLEICHVRLLNKFDRIQVQCHWNSFSYQINDFH